MDTAALQLTSRFSFSPNKLGYCGLNSANQVFTDCILHNHCDQVPNEIPHFKGLYPYLKTIAEVLNKHFLDYEVVEAYWLGNKHLAKFRPEHYGVLIKNLVAQDLPDFFIEEIKNRPPKAFIPLHLFNVLHIGVGRITGSVPFNLNSINNCMVRWGKVTTTNSKQNTAEVVLHSLTSRKNLLEPEYRLVSKTKTVDCHPDFLPGLKIGDTIAVHWHWACKILTEAEQTNLEHWTNTVLQSLLLR